MLPSVHAKRAVLHRICSHLYAEAIALTEEKTDQTGAMQAAAAPPPLPAVAAERLVYVYKTAFWLLTGAARPAEDRAAAAVKTPAGGHRCLRQRDGRRQQSTAAKPERWRRARRPRWSLCCDPHRHQPLAPAPAMMLAAAPETAGARRPRRPLVLSATVQAMQAT